MFEVGEHWQQFHNKFLCDNQTNASDLICHLSSLCGTCLRSSAFVFLIRGGKKTLQGRMTRKITNGLSEKQCVVGGGPEKQVALHGACCSGKVWIEKQINKVPFNTDSLYNYKADYISH